MGDKTAGRYLRLFMSAVDPADVEEVRRLFERHVQPAFLAQPGCLGIELAVSVQENAGGLVEGTAISRWESVEEMERGRQAPETQRSLEHILQLLRQEPVSKVYEVLA
ncbi:MAG: antibiotic biosynthesis monooxygenase family protein [Acidimicrobiales bacterium]